MHSRPKHPEWKLSLKKKKGDPLLLTLRLYQPGDEEGIIACIREEYGQSYFKRHFYDPNYLAKKTESGEMTFLIGETQEKEIAGILLLKEFYPEESMCEIATQIIRKAYRCCGLAEPLFDYGLEILKSRSYSAAFCLPVLFHDVTQRLLYRKGLYAAGFFLNVLNMEGITHSYNNGKNTKHSQGIQVRAMGKTNAGVLYLPQEHRDFCQKLYERLGAGSSMAEDGRVTAKFSTIIWENDPQQSSLEIQIYQVGSDLKDRMAYIWDHFPHKGRQTSNVLLNINDPGAEWAYVILKDMGCFFTGLKPLCSSREYMVLHHRGQVTIYPEDYVLSWEFAELMDYVMRHL